MDVYTAIRGRRSITGLTDDVPDRAALDRIIQASVWAPNHHLTEPWRFHVLCGAARDEMGAMVADRLEAELDPDDPASAPSIRSARVRLRRSPVVIVVSQVWSDDPVTNLEDYASVCCATQNLMLAAHAEGLATKWRTGEMCDFAACKDFLGLDQKDRIVGYIYLGHPSPGVGPDRRERQPAQVAWFGWDDEA